MKTGHTRLYGLRQCPMFHGKGIIMAIKTDIKFDARDLLSITSERRASDLHLTPNSPPVLRIDGKLTPIDSFDALTPGQVQNLVEQLMDEEQIQRLNKLGEVDFSCGIPGTGRFRCHAYKQRGTVALAARLIPDTVIPLEELGLPPVVKELCTRTDGLILVTGPTGSGKTTTLATMIDEINQRRSCVIITLEDPIEYLHKHKKSVINQREIGSDTRSFAGALRAALRADPDVILVGEMRDLETIQIAITAAETGHLVLSTLHTRSAAESVDRIIDVFPPHQQQQVRLQLASVLQAVISQRLIPRLDGEGRVPAVEIMLGTVAIRNLIREGKTHQIPAVIETGSRYGMQTFEASLNSLVERGLIDPEEAFTRKHR